MLKAKFQEFFNEWNGRPCEVNDPSNYAQCMDLAYAWLDKLQITRDTIRHLYAYEVWTKPNDLTVKFFELIPNTPMGMPQCGDLVIFSNKVGTAGHISISNGEGTTNSFTTFDQNFGPTVKKCGLLNHPYDAVLGWLRPRVVMVPVPLPGPVITDSTKIDLGPVVGTMEVQAIRSELADSRRAIEAFKIEIARLEAIVAQPNASTGLLESLKYIIWDRWTWIGERGWKNRLAQLKELLPF